MVTNYVLEASRSIYMKSFPIMRGYTPEDSLPAERSLRSLNSALL